MTSRPGPACALGLGVLLALATLFGGGVLPAQAQTQTQSQAQAQAQAQSEVQAIGLDVPGARETLAEVEEALNAIDTMSANFIQVSSDGSAAEGTILLDRPGRLRMDYAPPVQLQVIADGVTLNVVDFELKELTSIPLSLTAANFLLRERIAFGDGLEVTALRREAGLVRIDLVQSEAREAGSVELVMTEKPYALLQWTVTDAQGEQTRVTLFDMRLGVDVPWGSFLVNPTWLQGDDSAR